MHMRRGVKIYLMTVSFAVLLLMGFSQSATAAPIAQDVEIVTDLGISPETLFDISSAGTYVATLEDKGFPEAFDFLGLSIDSETEELALLFGPGTMLFNVSGPIEAKATVIWDTTMTGIFDIGKYQWSIEVIPEPTSMFLLGSGLVGLAALKAGRRKWQA